MGVQASQSYVSHASIDVFIHFWCTVPRPALTDSFIEVVTQNLAALDAAILNYRDFEFT